MVVLGPGFDKWQSFKHMTSFKYAETYGESSLVSHILGHKHFLSDSLNTPM